MSSIKATLYFVTLAGRTHPSLVTADRKYADVLVSQHGGKVEKRNYYALTKPRLDRQVRVALLEEHRHNLQFEKKDAELDGDKSRIVEKDLAIAYVNQELKQVGG